MEKDITKKYTNGEITVVWKPATCIHSTICWKGITGLSEVFNPKERPWIKMEGASSERIAEQVSKCPSGALSFYYNNDQSLATATITTDTQVEVLPRGPLLVYGNITVKDKDGQETKKHKVTAFCRCGHSQNKPYCDGTHVKMKFED
ncbi:MAG TPA: (4Fe-4S)-binding protein [Chitinophagaceae bacterium]|nr:(4Fe-4S)-binding protein [Chitinophagaceae bacterium]